VNKLRHTFTNFAEIVKIVTELKTYAKKKEGSFFAIDKRGQNIQLVSSDYTDIYDIIIILSAKQFT
jgi:hypothetical protein